MRGYHLRLCVFEAIECFFSLRFSVGRCLYCGRDEAAVMTTNRHKCSSFYPPHPSVLVLPLCLHATFCFCPSVPASLSSHTHTLPSNFNPRACITSSHQHSQAVPPSFTGAMSKFALHRRTLVYYHRKCPRLHLPRRPAFHLVL